jgi:integrase
VRANRELAVLKKVFNRCREWKLIEAENPVKTVRLTKELRQRLRFLEPEEEDRLLAECAEPLRMLILIGTNCGLRLKSEALTLRWADIDIARKILTVAAAYAKSGTCRSLSLNSAVLAALSQLPRISDFVFAKPNGKPYHGVRGFHAACQRAGLTGVTPHTLRHTFATRLVENGVDRRTVQELGGWATLSLIQRYAHVSHARKAEAVEGLVRKFPYAGELTIRKDALTA